ncbi:MAG: metal-dependent hydrolase [Actinomycetota bacterium]|nr:metal-dependent hydrolase [Actinomycetota bacterium]
MIFWYMGLAALVVYVTLGRRRIDYRFVLIGAVAPDVVDALLGVTVFDGPSEKRIGHSLLSVIVIAVAIVLTFDGERRLAVFGVAVGWLLHLVGDGMWNAPRTFLWPAFGTEFARAPGTPISGHPFADPMDNLGTWGKELFGLAVLLWFWVAFRLGSDGRFRLFLRDGYLRP